MRDRGSISSAPPADRASGSSATPPPARRAPPPPPEPEKGPTLVLVAVSGEIEVGDEYVVAAEEPLPIGRASKGVQLTDPLVSIHHAKIFHDAKRGFVVEDLKSATGTWVDEECVRGESRPIGVGTRLRFGDTTFEVQAAQRTPTWVKGLLAGALGLAALAALALVLFGLQGILVAPAAPTVRCPPSDLVGTVAIEDLALPEPFLRERALLAGDLTCTRTTDHDDDGRAEAWLTASSGATYVVQPEDQGTWRIIGELPANCSAARDNSSDFPFLDCAGEQWTVFDGRYQVVGHEGVVVWYRESDTPAPPVDPKAKAPEPTPGAPAPGTLEGMGTSTAPVKVGRFAMKGDRLGAFLSFRGVNRPIHYLICEEAFEGIAAQALTDDEGVTGLRIGCISDLRLEGPTVAKPIAIALSPEGRRALVRDVVTFYGGNPDGLFLDDRWRELVDQVSAEPGFLVGARKLVGDTKESDVPLLSPFPDPTRPIRSAHVLDARDSRLSAARIASSVTITEPGRANLDLDGCALLEVDTSSFASYGFQSLFSRPFVTITETGCGAGRVASAGYGGGTWDFTVEGFEVRLVTEAKVSTRGPEIARARITWRPTKAAATP